MVRRPGQRAAAVGASHASPGNECQFVHVEPLAQQYASAVGLTVSHCTPRALTEGVEARSGVPSGTDPIGVAAYSRGQDADLRSRMFRRVHQAAGRTGSGRSAPTRAHPPIRRRSEQAEDAPSADPDGLVAAALPRDRSRGAAPGGEADTDSTRPLGSSELTGLAPNGHRLTLWSGVEAASRCGPDLHSR
jgi:hypothetical protein